MLDRRFPNAGAADIGRIASSINDHAAEDNFGSSSTAHMNTWVSSNIFTPCLERLQYVRRKRLVEFGAQSNLTLQEPAPARRRTPSERSQYGDRLPRLCDGHTLAVLHSLDQFG